MWLSILLICGLWTPAHPKYMQFVPLLLLHAHEHSTDPDIALMLPGGSPGDAIFRVNDRVSARHPCILRKASSFRLQLLNSQETTRPDSRLITFLRVSVLERMSVVNILNSYVPKNPHSPASYPSG